jgi:hemerythrin-like domain-containing protein
MLKEHENIVVALDALANAARQENKLAAQQFAEKLKQHAKTEEEVLYPAAILVGDYIELKLNR